MKVCPKCNQSYDDPNLNFCLSDGELLMELDTNDAPPTIMMDSSRVTNEGNWGGTDQNPNFAPPPQMNQPNQEIFQQPFNSPQSYGQTQGKDQTLPVVSIISGALSVVLSLCCYMGVFIGPIALITGFIGMNNVRKNPEQYDGKNLAVAGMIAGGVGFGISFLMIVFIIFAQLIGG